MKGITKNAAFLRKEKMNIELIFLSILNAVSLSNVLEGENIWSLRSFSIQILKKSLSLDLQIKDLICTTVLT